MHKSILLLVGLVIAVMMLLIAIGCDKGPTITYENRASDPVWIDLGIVPHEFTGWHIPRGETLDEGPILSGQSKGFIYFGIPMGREVGEQIGKYVISAIVKEGSDTVGTVIWQRIFTWTELDDMEWKVVIKPQ